MKNKTTLDDLFESKKLDLPDDDFWNEFQDRVKGRAIAALGERSKTARLRKLSIYGSLPALILSFLGWNMLGDSIISSNDPKLSAVRQSKTENQVTTQLSLLIEEDFVYEREGAVQLAKLDSFDSFTNAQIRLSGLNSSFTQHSFPYRSNSGTSSRFTF